ncbi:hypothetical protein [Paenibacillus sp. PL91]|uniref:hypothetical protein n=1 Tax=Paenibacillus sp. PL91 TaxID=2729538 RepID=UPI00145CB376|nr:hypothetical protein [Paenibacillus sp. PL91]MBC9203398.1 hypothetical protein [Paenibacillus sp. PL91]
MARVNGKNSRYFKPFWVEIRYRWIFSRYFFLFERIGGIVPVLTGDFPVKRSKSSHFEKIAGAFPVVLFDCKVLNWFEEGLRKV